MSADAIEHAKRKRKEQDEEDQKKRNSQMNRDTNEYWEPDSVGESKYQVTGGPGSSAGMGHDDDEPMSLADATEPMTAHTDHGFTAGASVALIGNDSTGLESIGSGGTPDNFQVANYTADIIGSASARVPFGKSTVGGGITPAGGNINYGSLTAGGGLTPAMPGQTPMSLGSSYFGTDGVNLLKQEKAKSPGKHQ